MLLQLRIIRDNPYSILMSDQQMNITARIQPRHLPAKVSSYYNEAE
jgi:hypothetical protein